MQKLKSFIPFLSSAGNATDPHSNLAETNDAAALRSKRSIQHSRSPPTARASDTHIPRSPTHTSREHSSSGTAVPSGRRLQHKAPRISDDEKRLCGDFTTPADAVLLPPPAAWFSPPVNMKRKPGATSGYAPMNTLNSPNPFQARQSPKNTYSKSSRPSMAAGQIAFETAFFDNQSNPTPRSQRAPSPSRENQPSPGKRRKLQHDSSLGLEVIEVEDDDAIKEASPPFPPNPFAPSTPPPASSKSQRSNDGTFASRSKRNSELQTSGFYQVGKLTELVRKRPRRKDEQPDSSYSRLVARADKHSAQTSPCKGSHADRAIVLDGDEPKHSQGHYFNQRLSQRPATTRNRASSQTIISDDDELQIQNPETISKYFSSKSNGSSRINPSTRPRRSSNGDIQRPSAVRSKDLRTNFRRDDAKDSNEDDELAEGLVPRALRAQNRSPPKPTTPTNTEMRGRALPRSQNGWPLTYARSYDFNMQGPDLNLVFDSNAKVFRILRTEGLGKFEEIESIELVKIIAADTDEISRIRIKGSIIANGDRHWCDLGFKNTTDLRIFSDFYISKACRGGKVNKREANWMETAFNKPLERPRKLLTPLPGGGNDSVPVNNKRQDGTRNADERPRRGLLIDKLSSSKIDSPGKQASTMQQERPTRETVPTAALSRPSRTTRSGRVSYKNDADDDEVKIPEEEPVKFSIEFGLGKSWTRPVTYGSGRRRSLVNFNDLERLDEGEYLNDALIDFYLIYLFEQANIPANKVYFFNTHFYTTLMRTKGKINYDGVARWTAKEDIFNYDYIVVPVCENTHWYLAIICNVANIARKPILDDFAPSSPAREFPSEPQSEILKDSSGDDASKNAGTANTSAPIDLIRETSVAESEEDPMLLDEERRKSDEDKAQNEVKHDSLQATTPPNSSKLQSPTAEETARIEKLSIDDSIPKGILGDTSASPANTKKKGKRKSGPPMKKFDPEEPIVLILDSLGLSHPSTVRALKDYIRQEGQAKRGMDASITQNAFNVREAHIPMQSNWTDCGVYLLGYVQKFFADPRDFVTRILTREMDGVADWPDMKASQIRHAMREILQGLAKQQDADRKEQRKGKPAPVKTGQQLEPTTPKLLSPINLNPTARVLSPLKSPGEGHSMKNKVPPQRSPQKMSHKAIMSTEGGSPQRRSPKRSIDDIPAEHEAEGAGNRASDSGSNPKRRKLAAEAKSVSPKRSSPEQAPASPQTASASPYVRFKSPQVESTEVPPPKTVSRSKTSRNTPHSDGAPRGSSMAPIEIDDSQEVIAYETPKAKTQQLQPPPSVEEILKPGHKASRTKISIDSDLKSSKATLSKPLNGHPTDELLSQLQMSQASQQQRSGSHEKTVYVHEDACENEGEWQGAPDDDTSAANGTAGIDIVVPETPPGSS